MNTIDPRRQTRSSSETSYLRMVESSKALRIYNHTTAQRVLFNGTTASAVTVRSDNLTYTLAAKREVIVSAGAVSYRLSQRLSPFLEIINFN